MCECSKCKSCYEKYKEEMRLKEKEKQKTICKYCGKVYYDEGLSGYCCSYCYSFSLKSRAMKYF